jgi:epidermal growth factor receptor substrate 15
MADDEDHSSSVPDHSADLGNTKNALESTTRSVASLQTEKETLERTAKTSSAELHELEMRLSSVRAQHETETRLVNDLKTRTAEQKEKLNTLRDDLIRNESELSALRAEKDEIEQTLLQDKEEVRNLGKRMKEVTEETNTLKALLEKMKKEARQQKGMVAISKKQVSTLEGGRDSVQKDLDHLASTSHDETAEDLTSPFEERARSPEVPALVAAAAAIPLPSTPQRTLSPDSTGMSQKSNNPFDRLKREAPSLPSSPPTQARSPESEHEGMSSVPKAMLGMGGAIAAGALSAAAGVVDAGASAVSAITGKVHETEPAQDDKSITPEPESAAENITEQPTTAEPDEADPFGVPAMSPDLQQASAPTSPGFDDQDPFGLSSFGGVAAATKASDPAAGNDKVDTGFGDSFGDSFDASKPGKQPAAAANGADTDFDEAFRDFDNPAEAAPPPPPADEDALPNIPHPTVQERSLSTQALPPTSEVHTPISEMPSTEVSTPRVPDEKPVPVEVDALKPHPLTESATASPVAADLGDESSDDEDEGPEDLDRARTPFNDSTEGDQVDSAAAPAPDVQTAERNFPDIQTLGLGPTVQPAVEGISQPTEESRSKEGGEITPFPPAAVPVSPASPVAVTRREPPPPPTGGTKSPPSSQPPAQQPPSTNPFTMFSPGPAATSEPAQTDKTQEPATNAFDDDDFDFENLPSVQVAAGPAPAVPGTVSAPTGNTSRDFDAEFDDFSPDFEMVEPPPPQATVPAPQAQAQALHAAAFGSAQPSGQTSSTNTSGFDDEDWGNLPSATSVHAGQAATNQGAQGTAGAFSFDDAFGSDFSVWVSTIPVHALSLQLKLNLLPALARLSMPTLIRHHNPRRRRQRRNTRLHQVHHLG